MSEENILHILEKIYTGDSFSTQYSDEGIRVDIPNVSKNPNLKFTFYRTPGYDTPEFIEAEFKDKSGKAHNMMSYDFMYSDVNEYNRSNLQRLKIYDKYYDVDGEGGNIAGFGDMAYFVLKLQQKHYFVDDEGKVYYMANNNPAEETGFETHYLDSEALMFKDAFAICKTSNNEVSFLADIEQGKSTTTLYKRQEDGSYKQIWKSKDCIFQKEGFPDNVYFSGGSWRQPEMKEYFIDGQVDDGMKQKIDIAIKLDKLHRTKDLLQEKQQRLETAVGKEKFGKTDAYSKEEAKMHIDTAKQVMQMKHPKRGGMTE